MREDIKIGATFPDYELPDENDIPRKLSTLQGGDFPMILTLLRGYFCPKDRQQVQQLVAFYPQCVVGYTRLVTITMDTLLQLNEFRQGEGAHWPFLHDEDGTVRDDLDIEEYTDTKHRPMIPYTFVLEPELKIYKI